MGRMPGRRKGKGRKGGRGRSPRLTQWFEWKIGSAVPGSSFVFTVANIEAPRDRSYRLNSIAVQLCSTGPAMVIVRLFGPEFADQAIINSGVRLVGVVPVLVNLRAPPQTDWFQRAPPPAHPLVAVDCLCPSKGITKNVEVLINCRIHLTLSAEEVPESCPTIRPVATRALPWYIPREDEDGWETCEDQ